MDATIKKDWNSPNLKVGEWCTFQMPVGVNDLKTGMQNTVGQIVFEMFGYQWVSHSSLEEGQHGNFRAWEISERTTGRRIPFTTPALNKPDSITRAKAFLEEKGEAFVIAAMKNIQ